MKSNAFPLKQILVLVFAYLLPANLHAQVTISASNAAGVALTSAAKYRFIQDNAWKDYEDVVIISMLNGIAKMSATSSVPASTADYTSAANQVRAWLDGRPPQDPALLTDHAAGLRYAIDSLAPLASSAPAGSFLPAVLGNLERLKFNRLENALDPSRQTPADLALYSLDSNAYQWVGDQTRQAWDLARNDPVYAAAVNAVMNDLTGFDTTNSYSQIQQFYFNALPLLTFNGDGSLTIDARTLMTGYNAVMSNIQSFTDSNIALLQNSAGSSASVLRAAAVTSLAAASTSGNLNGPCSDPNQKAPCWNDVKTHIDEFSQLIKYTGSLGAEGADQLSTEISTVGGAATQIGNAIQLMDTKGFSLGGMKDIVTAGIAIFKLFNGGGLFGGGSPSQPDAAVLQQIQKLSQQIASFQQNVNSRFDHVDATLNAILATLNQNFQQIDYTLGVLNGDVHSVQAGLFDVQAQLNRLEQYTLVYDQALSKETLISDMNGCLNYATIHLGADIGQSPYNTCENDFYTWAHDSGIDELWAGILQPDYSDGNIYNTLFNFPFSVDINYLAQLPIQNLGLSTALSGGRLANPNEWTLGARAYLELAHEWPQYATQVNSSRLGDLVQVGAKLQQGIQSANSIRTGTTISPNNVLFNALENKYVRDALNIEGALQADTNTFISGLLGGAPLQGFDLWGGPNQTTSYLPPVTQQPLPAELPASVYGGTMLTPPPGLALLVPPSIKLLDQLGAAKLHLEFSVSDPVGDPSRPQVACASGQGVPRDVTIDGELFSGTVTAPPNLVFSQVGSFCARDGSNVFLSGDENSSCFQQDIDCFHATISDWQNDVNGVRSSWAASSVLWQPNANVVNFWLNYWSQILTSRLQSDQQQLYTRLSGDFSAATQVRVAGQQLTGAKLLLQAYANLGLPQSLQTNDALHSSLYGNQAIVDSSALQSDFLALSNTNSLGITTNGLTFESSKILSLFTSLSTNLNSALTQIQQSQIPDSSNEVDVTLEDLRAFETLKNANALPACEFQLSSPSARIGRNGGTAVLTVITNGCPVPTKTTAPWLQVSTTQVNPGESQISISVASNATGSSRSDFVIIGDQVYDIFQDNRPLIGCDVNGDGTVNILDIQKLVNQILGLAPATWDINGDGFVNILDLQKVVNAALGLGCDG